MQTELEGRKRLQCPPIFKTSFTPYFLLEEKYGTCLKRAYIVRLPALFGRNLELFLITTIAAA